MFLNALDDTILPGGGVHELEELMQARQAVAIIGGGASGLFTAIQIISQGGRNGPRVYLIEKEQTFGFGAAYSTNDPSHLLNTRVGNMSGFPDKPRHFLDWLQTNSEGSRQINPSSFVSRQTYGRYLRSLLCDAVTGADAVGRFYIVPDEAVSVRRALDGGFSVQLALGKEIKADSVVLALGNPPPHPPGIADSDVLASPHYIGDPWSCSLSEIEPKEGPILILGTGLTMVDVVMSLAQNGHRGPIMALSRRGLIPRRHAEAHSGHALPAPAELSLNIVSDLRAIRRLFREQNPKGVDWRDAVDALRPITTAYWRLLPLPDQKRFLRHLRPWWDVHRHRLAPQVAEELDSLLASGTLKIMQGRLKSLGLTNDLVLPVSVTWTPKAARAEDCFFVSKIINCMGPGGNLRFSPFVLIRQMLAEGLIEPDALALGLAVDDEGRALTPSGEAEPGLFALGPITRGTFWEVTAIPDIRVKAAEVAVAVLLALKRNVHAEPKRGGDAAA